MFEYKVVRIPISMWTGKPKKDYLSVIRDYADEGWRCLQVYNAPNFGGLGGYYLEVIFEKPRKAA